MKLISLKLALVLLLFCRNCQIFICHVYFFVVSPPVQCDKYVWHMNVDLTLTYSLEKALILAFRQNTIWV